MFKNKEESKLLSDDDFERVGRRKKTITIIVLFIIIVMVGILTYKVINKGSDNNINVDKQKVSTENKERVEDETTVLKKDTTSVLSREEEYIPSITNRNTVAGKNEFICEFSDINLPELLQSGDYADIRLSLADGRDYTVVSEKKIMDFNKSKDKPLLPALCSHSFSFLPLCEEEIVIMDSALSDLKLFEGSRLYLAIGRREVRSKVNYPVNKQTYKLLHSENRVNNLSGYDYEVKFDKELEKERLTVKKIMYYKGQEWKETASYWNDKE